MTTGRMGRPRTEVDEAAVLEAYRSGTSMSAIAIDHDISRDIVRRVLSQYPEAKVLQFRSSYAPVAPDGHVTSVELMQRSGITYRQLDYWTRAKRLQASTSSTPGSGSVRFFPASEIAVARLVARFVNDEVAPAAAFRVARELIETGSALLAGIRIDLPEEH